MPKYLQLFMFFCFLLDFNIGKTQCVQVLTDNLLEVCSAGGTTVNIVTEGDYFAVEWTPTIGLDNPNVLNPTFSNPIDTTYLLILKGQNKETGDTCETRAFIEIKTVQFDLVLPQDTVELPCGDSIRLPAQVLPSESYFLTEWTTSTGNFVQGNQLLNPLIDATGIYRLNAIGTLGRIVCEAKDSLTVVYSNDNRLVIEPPESFHCNQSTVTLSVANVDTNGLYLYNWTTSEGNFTSQTDQAIVVVDEIGEYEVTRTDLYGECLLKQKVSVAAKEIENFTFKINQPNCQDVAGSIVVEEIIGGIAPFIYSNDNGLNFQTSREFFDLNGGAYNLVVQDANGCDLMKSASIIPFPSFEVELLPKVEIERGGTNALPLKISNLDTEISEIEWQPSYGLSCTDCPNPTLLEFRNGIYTVKVIGANGCEVSKTIEIIIKEPSLFYAPTIFSPNGDGQNDDFTVFPNLKITEGLTELAIFDRYGNLVFQKSTNAASQKNSWNGRHKGKEMPNGTYIYWAEIILKDGDIERINGTINLVR